ncbi:Wadjet anti-phage system protein JetD domain-containing protein [Plantactinospora sp. CA-290183]|uniref:Wadjet anti-phage system protein JetD domain-containing protein n=1 Tax=Plantactinospora sp. CA-290183 TaxID=3240006 RepID=UPI003D8FCA4B
MDTYRNAARLIEPVAREERSLKVFGDEKTLARIESSSIFAPDRLQPSDLAYEQPTAPLRAARLADCSDLLVIENQSTFDSAWRALHRTPGPFAAVAFGNGWEAAQPDPIVKIADHLQLRAAPERIFYVGDLDIAGLDIPQTLAASLTTLGHPTPQPLTHAYGAMLQAAGDRAGRPTAPVPTELAYRAATWLAEQSWAALSNASHSGHLRQFLADHPRIRCDHRRSAPPAL